MNDYIPKLGKEIEPDQQKNDLRCTQGKITEYSCEAIGKGDQSKCTSGAGIGRLKMFTNTPDDQSTDCYHGGSTIAGRPSDDEAQCAEGYKPETVLEKFCKNEFGQMSEFTCVQE